MPNRSSPVLCGLAALLTLSALASARADDARKKVRVERHKVVLVDKDGDVHVLEDDGPKVSRGFLGVELTDLTPELRTHFGAPEKAGVMVARVTPDSPAAKAGVQVGDIISGLDGKPVEDSFELRARIGEEKKGTQVALELWRDGKSHKLTATLDARARTELDLAPFFVREKHGRRIVLRLDTPPMLPGDFDGLDGGGDRQVRIERFGPDRTAMESRLDELEKRLDALQKQLDGRK